MAKEFIEPYRSRAVVWRGMFLFPTDVALELLKDCEQKDIRILGCDVFDMPVGDTILSRFDNCLDVSTKEYWDYSVVELCGLVRDHILFKKDKLFEFTLS
jgi:hypothetical protein